MDVLVLNALRRESHLSHFTLEEALELASKIGTRQTYFTHISHQLGFHESVNAELPEGWRWRTTDWSELSAAPG